MLNLILSTVIVTGATAVDGDTLRAGGQSLRVWGIDAPEAQRPGGQAAKQAMANLIREQSLTCEAFYNDRYGRPVVRCYLPDGRDLDAVMWTGDLSRSLAWTWSDYRGAAT